MNPKVSIIIPVYNRESLIIETLNSIENVEYDNIECIVVDDHSTDNTFKVVENFISNSTLNLRLFKRPDTKKKGANSCRNFGLDKSTGEYIHWFDSDDLVHPSYLQVLIPIFSENNIDFVKFRRFNFTNRNDFKKFLNSDINLTNPKKSYPNLLYDMLSNKLPFNTCNLIWRKSSIKNQYFSEEIVYADEWEFYSRLLANNLQGLIIDNVFYFSRKHNESTTYEYANSDPTRKKSKQNAIMLVANNLIKKDKINTQFINLLINLSIKNKNLEPLLGLFNKNLKFKYKVYTYYHLLKNKLKINLAKL